MAKTDRLVIAYFPTEADANEAGELITWWDDQQTFIDLQAVGVMTMKDGKVKTEQIGERATATGAGWGLLIGAVTGIFTGGLTLLGGAIAGLAIGSITGHFFHHRLGMNDEEKAQLEAHLEDGGAALAIVTPEEQVEATVDTLEARTKDIVVFRMSDETVQEITETAEEASSE